MTKTKALFVITVLSFTIPFVLAYLTGAFYEWSLSPGQWSPGTREACAIGNLIVGCAITFFASKVAIGEYRNPQ